MFQIFHGITRGIGVDQKQDIWCRIGVNFRNYLREFRGCELYVFIAIMLHADESGWSSPTISRLRHETGYELAAVSAAITELCKLTIDGSRLLLAIQRNEKGKFTSNSYLIFPSQAEIEEYSDVTRRPRTNVPSNGFPNTVKPNTENQTIGIKKNRIKKNEPVIKENTAASSEADSEPRTALIPKHIEALKAKTLDLTVRDTYYLTSDLIAYRGRGMTEGGDFTEAITRVIFKDQFGGKDKGTLAQRSQLLLDLWAMYDWWEADTSHDLHVPVKASSVLGALTDYRATLKEKVIEQPKEELVEWGETKDGIKRQLNVGELPGKFVKTWFAARKD